jgi:hypothetical protein
VFSLIWTQYKYKQYYIYIHTQNMYPKVELVEEIKGGGNEGKKDGE